MFQVGDEVVYPPFGAGSITAIEERNFLDKGETYYVIKFLFEDLSVYIPSSQLRDKNIRYAMNVDHLKEVMSRFTASDYDFEVKQGNWRTVQYEKLLATADLEKTLYMIKGIKEKKKERNLNQIERDIYCKFYTMLVSEIMLVEKLDQKGAEDVLDSLLRIKQLH